MPTARSPEWSSTALASAKCGELFHQCRRSCGAAHPPRGCRPLECQPRAPRSGRLQHWPRQNGENFSTNAADHAALRIRRGDADPLNANRALPGVVVYSIGLGNVDSVLLERIANDPSLTPNPVAAGNTGRYVYAADATQLNLAFTQVASQLLRLAR